MGRSELFGVSFSFRAQPWAPTPRIASPHTSDDKAVAWARAWGEARGK